MVYDIYYNCGLLLAYEGYLVRCRATTQRSRAENYQRKVKSNWLYCFPWKKKWVLYPKRFVSSR